MSGAATMLLALMIDAGFGWPAAIHVWIGHPVGWVGTLVSHLDRHLNRESSSEAARRVAGVFVAIAVVSLAAGVGWACTLILPQGWIGLLLASVLAWPLIAARSMHDHVVAV